MKITLIKQAIYLPVVYFGTVILAGFFAVDYSHIGQQVSELALNESIVARKILSIGIFASGLSMVLFGLGLILNFKKQFLISSFLIIIFGITFLFGALFAIGSPWHSAYGIGFCVVVLPFAYLHESGAQNIDKLSKLLAIIATIVIVVYFWSLLAKLHPWDYRGLAQRVFGIALFTWMSHAAFTLCKIHNPVR